MKKFIVLFLCSFLLFGCSKKESEGATATTHITNSTVKESSSIKDQISASSESSVLSESYANSESTETSESIINVQHPTLDEFVGGWGIPNSGNLFFINSNATVSSATIGGEISNIPMENLNLYYSADGKSVLSCVMNGSHKELIKEIDGTVTGEGLNYTFLGNVTLEEYLENK